MFLGQKNREQSKRRHRRQPFPRAQGAARVRTDRGRASSRVPPVHSM